MIVFVESRICFQVCKQVGTVLVSESTDQDMQAIINSELRRNEDIGVQYVKNANSHLHSARPLNSIADRILPRETLQQAAQLIAIAGTPR